MTVGRLPPLALAIVLVAAALVATTWATARTVGGAVAETSESHAKGMAQSVRGDLAQLGGEPSPDDLADIVRERPDIKYLALLDNRGRVVAHVGDAYGTPSFGPDRRGREMHVEHVHGRVRVDERMSFRRAFGTGPRLQYVALEVEPTEADELRAAARRTFAIVGLAALTLLGVGIGITRRELRRRVELADREREKRLASLGEMSAVLAHEIKNPLASLKGNAQLLASSLPAGDKPRRQADRVVDEAVRLEKLTEDLLAFVRTGSLQRAPASPSAIARDAAGAVAGEVSVDDRGAPPMWSLDAGRVREVLVNLVDNAVAAGPPVWLRVFVDRGRLVFEVIDRGPGVPAADRDKIFEPFFTGKTRGTGLGLAIAKRMIELHGGTIAVLDSEQPPGARFRIEIPEA
ncbi:MAG TPA: HAMP domain-containing sensor histidine kinase [Kofleriaceae bacterium]|jgi:two-component system sensor histidine kinase HydH